MVDPDDGWTADPAHRYESGYLSAGLAGPGARSYEMDLSVDYVAPVGSARRRTMRRAVGATLLVAITASVLLLSFADVGRRKSPPATPATAALTSFFTPLNFPAFLATTDQTYTTWARDAFKVENKVPLTIDCHPLQTILQWFDDNQPPDSAPRTAQAWQVVTGDAATVNSDCEQVYQWWGASAYARMSADKFDVDAQTLMDTEASEAGVLPPSPSQPLPIRILQLSLLPALVVVGAGTLIAQRFHGRRPSRPKVLALVTLVDAWLWLVAISAPLGPHLVLLTVLIVVHTGIAFAVIENGSGFTIRRKDRQVGRYRRMRDGRSGYQGYRGD